MFVAFFSQSKFVLFKARELFHVRIITGVLLLYILDDYCQMLPLIFSKNIFQQCDLVDQISVGLTLER